MQETLTCRSLYLLALSASLHRESAWAKSTQNVYTNAVFAVLGEGLGVPES